jgi:hypothetical protein
VVEGNRTTGCSHRLSRLGESYLVGLIDFSKRRNISSRISSVLSISFDRLGAFLTQSGLFLVRHADMQREEHDATWVSAMAQSQCVPDLVYSLLRRPLLRELHIWRLLVELRSKPVQRYDGSFSKGLGHSEYEVHLRHVEVCVCDA